MRHPAVLTLCTALALGACSLHVERPQLHPQRVDWRGVDARGVSLRVTIAAYNPNDFELPLRDLHARLILAGRDTGSTVTNLDAVLPPRREIPVTVDAFIPWSAAPDVGWVLAMQPLIDYRVEGTLSAHHYITVTASFAHTGTVERAVILGELQRGVNGVLGTIRGILSGNSAPAAPASTDAGRTDAAP